MRRLLAAMTVVALLAGVAPARAVADGNRPPVAVDDPPIGPACQPAGLTGGSFPLIEDYRSNDPWAEDWFLLFGGCSPLANDLDPDGDALTLEIVDQPPHGKATWIPGDVAFFGYRPEADWSTAPGDQPGGTWVSDTVTYRLFDGEAYSNTASYRYWVAPVNDPPSFTPGAPVVVARAFDGPVSIPWATAITPGPANEADQAITFDLMVSAPGAPDMFATPPAIAPDGVLTFRPGRSPGLATIQVTATDDGGLEDWGLAESDGAAPDNDSDPVTFQIAVQPADPAPPDAVDDEATVVEDLPKPIGVLQNDRDRNGDPFLLTAFTDPPHGTVDWGDVDGALLYSPDRDYAGSDAFDYTISDGPGSESTATVTVTVTPVNDDPVANPDEATVGQDTGPVIIDVLANDTDPDGDTLAVDAVAPDTGVAAVVPDGVSYEPADGFTGETSLAYRVTDGHGGVATATVSINVIADTAPPSVTAPTQAIAGSTVGASTVRVRLGWSGTDAGTGIASYQLQERRGSGSWHAVALAGPTTRSATRSLDLGHAYAFRVRASDEAGNTSGWLTWGPLTPRLRQESSGTASWSGSWRIADNPRLSAGASRWTDAPGRRVTFTVTGRAFAWVSRPASGGGSATVLVDGVVVGTVSCRGALAWRTIVFRAPLGPGSHRVQIRPKGNGRVDIDALVVLR